MVGIAPGALCDRADSLARRAQRERTCSGPAASSTSLPAWSSRISPSSCWSGYAAPFREAGCERRKQPWQAGRLDSSSGPHRLLFGHMYEDAEIERAAFQGKGRVFCIASAGATAVRLAEQHEVVACDINPAQLAYAERRARGGPAVETGDAERAMNFARAFMPLVGWRAGVLRAFLALSDVAEQMAFWRKHLDTRRFRAGFDALMSPACLRAVYAPQFLPSCPPIRRGASETAGKRIRPASKCIESLRASAPPRRNQRGAAPHGRPNIQFVLADAASWLESCPARLLDAFALSNILDGAEPAYRSRLSRAVRRAATEEAVVVLAKFCGTPPGFNSNHAECDRSMLWGVVEVRSAQDLEDHPIAAERPTPRLHQPKPISVGSPDAAHT